MAGAVEIIIERLSENAELRAINPVAETATVSVANASVIATVADVVVVAAAAAAVCLAANANRMSTLITSLQANTQVVRIGDSNTGAARGIELAPGESVEIDTTAPIYAYTGAAHVIY